MPCASPNLWATCWRLLHKTHFPDSRLNRESRPVPVAYVVGARFQVPLKRPHMGRSRVGATASAGRTASFAAAGVAESTSPSPAAARSVAAIRAGGWLRGQPRSRGCGGLWVARVGAIDCQQRRGWEARSRPASRRGGAAASGSIRVAYHRIRGFTHRVADTVRVTWG